MKDLTGERFERLIVVKYIRNPGGMGKWECICDCGNVVYIANQKLKDGSTKSCGCLRKEYAKQVLIDLTGQRFHKFVVVEKAESNRFRQTAWKCLCDCGNEFVALGINIKKPRHTMSCGCHKKVASKTHGMSYTPEYTTWSSMIGRCSSHPDYAGRGIKVCEEWHSFEKFYEWFKPRYKEGCEIDRRDNDEGYSPENCRVVDRSTNMANCRLKKRNTSGFIGVIFDKRSNKWRAGLTFKGIFKNFGYFNSAIEAAMARDAYIEANNLPHFRQKLYTK